MAETDLSTSVVSKSEWLNRDRYFPSDGSPWAIFTDIEHASPVDRMRQIFRALAENAEIHGAATVAEAYEMAELVCEAGKSTGELHIVNSGTIDRYVSLWGRKRMRYLGGSYLRPVIPSRYRSKVPRRRLAQAVAPKIIIAGMTKMLDCVGDFSGSLLAAKSTTIIETTIDLHWLLGILNSRLLSFYYLSVFGGDRLQGGYLRIGPPQLRTLPVPAFKSKDPLHVALSRQVENLVELYERRLSLTTPHERDVVDRQIRAGEERVDRSVYKVYESTSDERRVVEKWAETFSTV
jgi:hypothetical protein